MDRDRTNRAAMEAQIALLGIAEGFFQSSVLFALLKLNVFERLGRDEKTLEELAGEIGARPDTLARLTNAGVVFGLLESSDGKSYRVHPRITSVVLPDTGENYLGNWLLNLDYFRGALEGLDRAVLESGPTVDPEAHIGAEEAATREFTLAMHNYASLRGQELARFLDLSDCATLLDLGAGPGTYAFHLGLANPGLQLNLLDLPGVLEVAKDVQERYPLENEVRYVPLDALKDEIPGTYDAVLVSNTLHMLGGRASSSLIERLYPVVNPGGSLIIQAQYLRDDRLGDRWPVLLDLIQLCITSEGHNHSVAETKAWLEEAGFTDIEYVPMMPWNTNSFLRGYKRADG